ncbi:MAG: hypothetical protein KJ799_10960 [Bacteroidetes bacterium]|nr:hypothetical protein [Bacteroidota bacterium]MBU2507228.1 hypothetical protein [Bacteroidota bacterium]
MVNLLLIAPELLNKKFHLERLVKLLHLDISKTKAVVFLLICYFFNIVAMLFLLSICFYIGYRLFHLQKYGWALAFAFLLIPLVVNIINRDAGLIAKYLLTMMPIAIFIFICNILRPVANNWLIENDARINRIEEKELELDKKKFEDPLLWLNHK